jgi:GntR family transcriptional regulator, transcriptional repressor for pyruvate dehydrogenase complex
MLKPIRRARLSESVAKQIKSLIKEGALKIGDHLPSERDLAIQLGISRTAIREGLRALELAGYLGSKVGMSGGTFVKEVSVQQIIEPFAMALYNHKNFVLDTLEVRKILEVRIAEIAARRRNSGDLKRIADSLAFMEKQIKEGRIALEGDSRFHYSLAQATHNQVLLKLMYMWTELVFETRRGTLERPKDSANALAEHRKIAEAIEGGNPKAAGLLMQRHLARAVKVISSSTIAE